MSGKEKAREIPGYPRPNNDALESRREHCTRKQFAALWLVCLVIGILCVVIESLVRSA